MSCRKWEVQILRWHEGSLDQAAEARILRHLEICTHCRALAERFAQLDSLLVKFEEPSLPPFLKDRIVGTVLEEMREDSTRGIFRHLFGFLASFRAALVGAILVLGIGLGIAAGWDLARSITPAGGAVSSSDLVSLAGLGGEGSGSSLEFIWTDSNGRAGQ